MPLEVRGLMPARMKNKKNTAMGFSLNTGTYYYNCLKVVECLLRLYTLSNPKLALQSQAMRY